MTLWMGKLLLLALCAVCLTGMLRGKTPALALPVSLAACGVLFSLLLPRLETLWGELGSMARSAGLDTGLFGPVLRVLAITELTRLGAELCRDGGEKGLAAALELCGTAASLVCVLPLAKKALELIGAIGS